MQDRNSKVLWIAFFIVFAINFAQSYYTELLPDEAYYWVYSQNLDWGYFDHPPTVATLIKLSSFLFNAELGVRFISGITFLLTAYLVWKTVSFEDKKNQLLFIALFFSIPMINVYGFITTPDTGLILFIAWFLFGWKRYLKNRQGLSYLILAIAAAGMLYSKYQGFLVIICVILSNPKILKDGKLWLAGMLTIVLLLPHIIWQFENDFPSIRYHLFERVANRRYKFDHTLMHFVNMIAIVGLVFPFIYKAFFKNIKSKDPFTKSLVYIVFGFFGLFFFSSFRGRVQAQWLVPICFSFIILTYDYFLTHKNSKKWLYILATANILILFIARIAFASDAISPVKLDSHGNKEWATELKEQFPNQPKFFVNSYQNASTYWFYTKEKPFYYKNFTGRKNHFNLMQENFFIDFDEVLFANRGRTNDEETSFKGTGKDSIYLQEIKDFYLPNQIKFEWNHQEKDIDLAAKNSITGRIVNDSRKPIDLNHFYFEIGFQHAKQRQSLFIPAKIAEDLGVIPSKESKEIELNFHIPNGNLDDYNAVGIGMKSSAEIEVFRISDLRMFTFTP